MLRALTRETATSPRPRSRALVGVLAARSVFFRREMRHCLNRTDPRTTLTVTELGGNGRDLFEFVASERMNSAIDALLVTRTCEREILVESSGWSRDALEGVSAMARFEIRQQSAAEFLVESHSSNFVARDLVVCRDLFDVGDEELTAGALRNAIALLRPGGIVVGACLDSALTDEELDGAASLMGVRPRARSADDLDRIMGFADPARRHRATQLERGPNRYLLVRRV